MLLYQSNSHIALANKQQIRQGKSLEWCLRLVHETHILPGRQTFPRSVLCVVVIKERLMLVEAPGEFLNGYAWSWS
ncbi:hypothetical protein WAI453_013258 [Rhynchosporium graminicola]